MECGLNMEKHKGYFAKGPRLTGTPIGLTRVRSILGRWISIRRRSGRDGAGAAAGRRRQGGGGGGSSDFTRYRISRLGSGSDRDGEVESDVRNRSRGFSGGEIGRSGRATASGGSETPARPCGRGRAGGRERDSREASSPRRGVPAVVVRWRGAREAVVRRAPEARAAMAAAAGAEARVLEARRLRLGENNLRVWAAFIVRPRVPGRAGPRRRRRGRRGVEPDTSSSPHARERMGRRRGVGGRADGPGRGRWATRGGEEKGRRGGRGWAARGKRKKGRGGRWLAGLGPMEKRGRGKKKEEKQMLLNLQLKFEFKFNPNKLQPMK
jgi:hypothetical protein